MIDSVIQPIPDHLKERAKASVLPSIQFDDPTVPIYDKLMMMRADYDYGLDSADIPDYRERGLSTAGDVAAPTIPISEPMSNLNVSAALTPNPEQAQNLNVSAALTPNPEQAQNLNVSAATTPNPEQAPNFNSSAALTPNPEQAQNLNVSAATTPNPEQASNLNSSAATRSVPQPPHGSPESIPNTPPKMREMHYQPEDDRGWTKLSPNEPPPSPYDVMRHNDAYRQI